MLQQQPPLLRRPRLRLLVEHLLVVDVLLAHPEAFPYKDEIVLPCRGVHVHVAGLDPLAMMVDEGAAVLVHVAVRHLEPVELAPWRVVDDSAKVYWLSSPAAPSLAATLPRASPFRRHDVDVRAAAHHELQHPLGPVVAGAVERRVAPSPKGRVHDLRPHLVGPYEVQSIWQHRNLSEPQHWWTP